jgi:hypothetical protein
MRKADTRDHQAGGLAAGGLCVSGITNEFLILNFE